jgi:hypothetical protein
MAECEPSRALHNGSLTSKAIDVASKGHLPTQKVVPAATPMASHGHTLQFLISIIKNSQQRSPPQPNQ